MGALGCAKIAAARAGAVRPTREGGLCGTLGLVLPDLTRPSPEALERHPISSVARRASWRTGAELLGSTRRRSSSKIDDATAAQTVANQAGVQPVNEAENEQSSPEKPAVAPQRATLEMS